MNFPGSSLRAPILLTLSSLGWVGATSLAAVHWLGMPTNYAWMMAGALTLLYGIAVLYMAWEYKKAIFIPTEIAYRSSIRRLARNSPSRRDDLLANEEALDLDLDSPESSNGLGAAHDRLGRSRRAMPSSRGRRGGNLS